MGFGELDLKIRRKKGKKINELIFYDFQVSSVTQHQFCENYLAYLMMAPRKKRISEKYSTESVILLVFTSLKQSWNFSGSDRQLR